LTASSPAAHRWCHRRTCPHQRPGCRHDKRWQDVEEVLDGIDVFPRNVQHLESLNDLVASFTNIRVRETLPDRVLDSAQIEVVDIPPDELIERLKAGKVYVPQEASRALSHFLKSNLTALRELALRRARRRRSMRKWTICAPMRARHLWRWRQGSGRGGRQ
jgi:K+-sensing histidine kinase KdpD